MHPYDSWSKPQWNLRLGVLAHGSAQTISVFRSKCNAKTAKMTMPMAAVRAAWFASIHCDNFPLLVAAALRANPLATGI
jgi:hypothetical protein